MVPPDTNAITKEEGYTLLGEAEEKQNEERKRKKKKKKKKKKGAGIISAEKVVVQNPLDE